MALDIFVMPFWKYLAGEYTTATERFAETSGTPYSRMGNPKAQASEEEARRFGRNVRIWMERRFLTQDAWDDDGETVFSEQFSFSAIHAVRAYAAHQQWSTGLFELQSGFQDSPLLRKIYGGIPTDFPHLIHHEDNQGFYVPLDFKHPTKLMGESPMIGSSMQLMFELAALRASLGEFPTYEEWVNGSKISAEHPGEELVKYGILFLYRACWLSVQHRLPIIFDG